MPSHKRLCYPNRTRHRRVPTEISPLLPSEHDPLFVFVDFMPGRRGGNEGDEVGVKLFGEDQSADVVFVEGLLPVDAATRNGKVVLPDRHLARLETTVYEHLVLG